MSVMITRKFFRSSAFLQKRKFCAQKTVKSFEEMPTLSRFELLKRFMPGGKFHKSSILEIQKTLREELGPVYRIPGMFGQNTNVTTFDADDIEYVHRNEGLYPFRRGLETMKHFRTQIRPDIFDVGGLIVE
jgi:cytochrome P450 family 12